MIQTQIPVDVPVGEIERQADFGSAVALCISLGGQPRKAVESQLHLAGGQLSRWIDGQEGIKADRLAALQAFCGNDAPTLWLAHAAGYDLHSLRRKETETERENRLLREENAALKRVLLGGKT